MTARAANDVAPSRTEIVVGWMPSMKARVVRHEAFAHFGALAHRLTQHAVSETKDGPGWVPGNIPLGPRRSELVTHWPVLALDIEGRVEKVEETGRKRLVGRPAPPMKEVVETVRARGWRACVATSWSHEEEAHDGGTIGPRYRLVFEVSRPVAVHELASLAEHVSAVLGVAIALDRSGYDANRFFYFPTCPNERTHLAERDDISGEALDVDALLAEANADASDTPLDVPRSEGAPPSVIAAFNALQDVGALLEKRGYVPKGSDRWLYPGSAGGVAGVVRLPNSGRVYSHHGNDPLWSPRGHDAFSVWCTLEHGGDVRRAVREAARELGIEDQRLHARLLTSNVAPAPPIVLATAEEIERRPPIEWRVKGVLPARGFAQVFGPSRSGKSFLVFDLACAIARGAESWFDFRVKQAPVVFAVLEGEAGLKSRAEAWRRHNGCSLPQGLRFFVDQPFDIRNDFERLAEATTKGSVVFIDTQSRAAVGVDENSGSEMSIVLDAAKKLADAIEGLVVFVSHTGKDETRGARGHSSQLANADAQIKVERNGQSRSWSVEKSKDAADGAKRGFDLHAVELGLDDDGDPITSCVIVAEDGPPRERVRPMALNSRLGLASFRIAAAEAGTLDSAQRFSGLHLEDWRATFYAMSECEPQSKKTAFTRARKDLVARGDVVVVNDVYRPGGAAASIDEDGFTNALQARGTGNTSGTNAEQCSPSQQEEREHTEHDSLRSVPCSPDATTRTRKPKPKTKTKRSKADDQTSSKRNEGESPEKAGAEHVERVPLAARPKRKPARSSAGKR